MKLYHGSPKKLEVIRPSQAKGMTLFENQKAIFLCKTFYHAALYAIGKSLKGKTAFVVTPRRLIIIGKKKPKSGYVYMVDVKAKRGRIQQFSYSKSITKFEIKKVLPKDYIRNILYVKDLEELKRYIK